MGKHTSNFNKQKVSLTCGEQSCRHVACGSTFNKVLILPTESEALKYLNNIQLPVLPRLNICVIEICMLHDRLRIDGDQFIKYY